MPWNVTAGNGRDLKRGPVLMLDAAATKRFGKFAIDDYRKMNDKRLKIVDTSRSAKSFTTTPLSFMDMKRAQELQPELLDGKTSYILVKLEPGTDVSAVKRELEAKLP